MSKFEAMRLVEIFSLHGRSKVTDCATLIFFSLSKNNEEKKAARCKTSGSKSIS
jgi:hypothetical protein